MCDTMPAMNDTPKRSKRIGLRLTDAEHVTLLAKAKLEYLTLSAWIRQRLLRT